MRWPLRGLLLSLLPSLLLSQAAAQEDSTTERHIIIVGESPTASDAVSKARQLSTKLGLPLGTRGMIVDHKGQLRWPADWTDKLYAGSYFMRRLDSDCTGDDKSPTPTPLGHCITVEKASSYGLRGKGYILVAGIVGDDEIASRMTLLRKLLPTVRDHITRIDMGCIH